MTSTEHYTPGDTIIIRDRDAGRVYVYRVPARWRRVLASVIGAASVVLYVALLPVLYLGVLLEAAREWIGGER